MMRMQAAADNVTAEENFDDPYDIRTSHDNLRPRKEWDYSHHHTMLEGIAMTQYPIKVFGDANTRAVIKELQQLHERQVIEPCNAEKMSKTEKLDALEYLMFLKKKQSGIIQGHGCADGCKQHPHAKKEDACAPTVALEALILSCTIDAMEKCDVATIEILMQADMNEVHAIPEVCPANKGKPHTICQASKGSVLYSTCCIPFLEKAF